MINAGGLSGRKNCGNNNKDVDNRPYVNSLNNDSSSFQNSVQIYWKNLHKLYIYFNVDLYFCCFQQSLILSKTPNKLLQRFFLDNIKKINAVKIYSVFYCNLLVIIGGYLVTKIYEFTQ